MGTPKKINIFLSYLTRPGGLFVVSSLLSVFLSLFVVTPAYAVDATWKNDSTITYNDADYTGPKIYKAPPQITKTLPDSAQYFTSPTRPCKIIFFNANVNLDTATQANFIDGGPTRAGCGYPDSDKDITLAARDGSTPPSAGDGGNEANETCNIQGVGWIVCPVAKFLGEITDGAYATMENFLVFRVGDNPLDTSDKNTVYQIWSNVRNLANIAFIFAFFAIIFSQATSIGIGSYGIKKMLPRLIVAAIMVNLSYFICVFAIDLSNIIGAGIDGIIKAPLNGALKQGEDAAGWNELVVVLLAGTAITGAAITGALALTLPFIAIALLAILTALIVLIARQALLILLIVVAPLAFVAYILPNTEDLFNRWRKLFIALLMFYPLAAVLFSGSQVASAIIRETAPEGITGSMLQIFSLAVLAFPLFGFPFLLKFSGGLLGRISGMVNNPTRGPVDRMRNKSKEISQNSAYQRGKGIRKQGRQDFKNKQFVDRLRRGHSEDPNARSRFTTRAAGGASSVIDSTPVVNKLPGSALRQAQSTALERVAISQEAKAFNERVSTIQAAYESEANPTSRPKDPATNKVIGYSRIGLELQNALKTGDRERAAASIAHLTNAGGAPGRTELQEVLSSTEVLKDANGKIDEGIQIAVTNAIYRDNYSSLIGKRGDVAKGGFDANGKWDTSTGITRLSSAQLAGSDTDTLELARDQGTISQAEALRILSEENLKSLVNSEKNLDILRDIATKPPTVPPPAGP